MKYKNRISLHWIRSMILLIIIILSLCSILLGYNLIAIRSQILKSVSTLTEYIQSSLDARFYEIQKYTTTLELHETNAEIKKKSGKENVISSEIYAFSDLISNYKLTNQFLEGIFIYYPGLDIIVGNLGVFSSRAYYLLDNKLDAAGYDRWIQDIRNSRTGLLRLKAGYTVQFCSIKNMMHAGDVVGYIVFRFNTDELLRSTQQIVSRKPSRQAFGIMLDNEILSVSGNERILQNFTADQAFGEGELLTISESNYLFHLRPSRFKGLHYLYAYYLPDTLRPLIIMLIICIAGILGIGIFGTVLSVSISRKNTEPLRSILDKLGYEAGNELNEYELIDRKIETLHKEKNIRVSKLNSQQAIIGGFFLNMVLNTDFETERAIFHAAKYYDIVFENPYYMIGIIKLDSGESDFLHAEIQQWFEDRQLDVIVSYLNRKYILLFNLEEDLPSRIIAAELEALLNESFWKRPYPAALGQCYDSLISLSSSYMEAMTALNQVKEVSPGNVSCYSNDMDKQLSRTYALDLERFIDALSQGQYREARKAYELFFAQCCSIHDTTQSLGNVFTPLIPLIREVASSENVLLENIAVDFFSFTSPKTLNHNILNFLDTLITAHSELPRDENQSIAKKAEVIISRDYTDSLLGLYRISEELGVCNSYLSTTFKNTFGIGVVQYINQLRINLAKELILNTEMNIKDIALAVGFSSDISFIRVFKKYEAKTPNTLRKKKSLNSRPVPKQNHCRE